MMGKVIKKKFLKCKHSLNKKLKCNNVHGKRRLNSPSTLLKPEEIVHVMSQAGRKAREM